MAGSNLVLLLGGLFFRWIFKTYFISAFSVIMLITSCLYLTHHFICWNEIDSFFFISILQICRCWEVYHDPIMTTPTCMIIFHCLNCDIYSLVFHGQDKHVRSYLISILFRPFFSCHFISNVTYIRLLKLCAAIWWDFIVKYIYRFIGVLTKR